MINLTKPEMAVIDFCFKTSEQKNHIGQYIQRFIELKDQPIVLDVYRKIRLNLEKDVKLDDKEEIEIEFTTEEKAMILKLASRDLPLEFLELAISLREKLK